MCMLERALAACVRVGDRSSACPYQTGNSHDLSRAHLE